MSKHRTDLANQVDQSKKVKRLQAKCSQLEAENQRLRDAIRSAIDESVRAQYDNDGVWFYGYLRDRLEDALEYMP